MRPEYDYNKGVRNKYAARLKPGSQIVVRPEGSLASVRGGTLLERGGT